MTHLQVIPFLVLAVGVDNMFILAHALQQQDPRLPIPERLGRALAGAGPSITLAAACEALAFGLGGLTSMPAVRNFSLCPAVAVLLDYALQVVVFTSPLLLFACTLTTICDLLSGGFQFIMRPYFAIYTCGLWFLCVSYSIIRLGTKRVACLSMYISSSVLDSVYYKPCNSTVCCMGQHA